MKKKAKWIHNELERCERDFLLKQSLERADLICLGRLFQCSIPLA